MAQVSEAQGKLGSGEKAYSPVTGASLSLRWKGSGCEDGVRA